MRSRQPRRKRWRRPSSWPGRARIQSLKRPSTTSTPRRLTSMAREMPYIAAIGEAIHLEMARDESVLYFGQNIATTDDDPFLSAFGADRVRVTPISETAEIGMAVGAALAGYRPVVELYMAEFMLVAMDQVVNEAPRFRYMSGGQGKLPLEPGEVPDGEYLVPFGQADIRRPGGDVTIVATGWMVGKALAAAESLAG